MGKRRGAAAAAAGSRSEDGEKRQVKEATGKKGAAEAGRNRSEGGEKREVKKATGKRVAAEAGRNRSEDGEKREVKKAKVRDSGPPTVVCDVISPVNFGNIIPAAEASPPILSVDSSLAQLPLIYVQFQHCSRQDAPESILYPIFSQFGEKIVTTYPVSIRDDFIFVLYKTRDGANKAVQDPLKKFPGGGELVCSITPHVFLESIRQTVLEKVTPLLHQLQHHPASTRVYVCNVNYQADPDEIKALFSQFGEITAGPLLFTVDPEWEIVHYLIVYKTEEEAKEALKQPDKQFGAHQLHCTGDLEQVVKTVQEEVLQEIETTVGRIISLNRKLDARKLDAAKTKGQLLQQQGAKPSLSSAINDVMVAAGSFKTAADMAVAAAERLNWAVDLISTQLQGSGAGATSG